MPSIKTAVVCALLLHMCMVGLSALRRPTLCALLVWMAALSALCGVLFLADSRFYFVSLVYAVLDVGLVAALLLLFVRRLALLLMLQKAETISVELSRTKSHSTALSTVSGASASSPAPAPSRSPVRSVSESRMETSSFLASRATLRSGWST